LENGLAAHNLPVKWSIATAMAPMPIAERRKEVT